MGQLACPDSRGWPAVEHWPALTLCSWCRRRPTANRCRPGTCLGLYPGIPRLPGRDWSQHPLPGLGASCHLHPLAGNRRVMVGGGGARKSRRSSLPDSDSAVRIRWELRAMSCAVSWFIGKPSPQVQEQTGVLPWEQGVSPLSPISCRFRPF